MHPVSKKVWLVAVSMGYGHLRAAMPLLPLAKEGRVITANDYEGIPDEDRRLWSSSEKFYNLVSRFKGKGFLGNLIFDTFDILQSISPFYPAKIESEPTFQLRLVYRNIRKGWGRHLVEKLMLDPAPLVTTFFSIAHMADYWNYPEAIYLIVTDSDISRVWVAPDPKKSNITYFASSSRSAERLKRYGVPPERIVKTGFPLPDALLGPRDKAAKEALQRRVRRLDPSGIFRTTSAGYVRQHAGTIEEGRREAPEILFAVGGAGAQVEIPQRAIPSLAPLLKKKSIILHLVAGVSLDAAKRMEKILAKADLTQELGRSVFLHVWNSKEQYFSGFEDLVSRADVLWTKPSELSFYPALGIPLLLTYPVGSQEVRNQEWLHAYGAAIDMPDPGAAGEWLPALIEEGRLAEAALNGYAKMERHGTANIRGYLTLGRN
jgi:hypothetical protein